MAPCRGESIHSNSQSKKILARITYYYPQSPYWNKVCCKNVKKAIEGITVAAHPDFKFGQTIVIPALKGKVGNGEFAVQDRGPAVTKKRASRGKGYVFDVFVNSNSKSRKLIQSVPMWMEVYIK
jgi:hypothetical protein